MSLDSKRVAWCTVMNTTIMNSGIRNEAERQCGNMRECVAPFPVD